MYLNALLTTSLDFLIRFIHFDSSAVQIKRGRGWDHFGRIYGNEVLNLEFWVLKAWSFRSHENNLAENFWERQVRFSQKFPVLVPVRLQTQKWTKKERKPILRLECFQTVYCRAACKFYCMRLLTCICLLFRLLVQRSMRNT